MMGMRARSTVQWRGARAAPAEEPDHVRAQTDRLADAGEAMARRFLRAGHHADPIAAPDELVAEPAMDPDGGNHQVAEHPQKRRAPAEMPFGGVREERFGAVPERE